MCEDFINIVIITTTTTTTTTIIISSSSSSYMVLGHLLTRFGLIHPEVSLKVFPGFFCLFVCRFLVFSFIYYEAFRLYVATNFFCITEFCPKLWQYLVLW
jgi:hypothetical protein